MTVAREADACPKNLVFDKKSKSDSVVKKWACRGPRLLKNDTNKKGNGEEQWQWEDYNRHTVQTKTYLLITEHRLNHETRM